MGPGFESLSDLFGVSLARMVGGMSVVSLVGCSGELCANFGGVGETIAALVQAGAGETYVRVVELLGRNWRAKGMWFLFRDAAQARAHLCELLTCRQLSWLGKS